MSYKKCRLAANMTQQQLADLTGVTKQCISQLENHLRDPSIKLLIHLAVILNVTTDELLGLNSPKTTIFFILSALTYKLLCSNIINVIEEV